MSDSEARTLTTTFLPQPDAKTAPVVLTLGPAHRIGATAPIVVAPKRGNRKGTSRFEKFGAVMRNATTKAGEGRGSVLNFCRLLDFDSVPVDPAWGVKDWRDAYKKKKLRSSIRGLKSRFSA